MQLSAGVQTGDLSSLHHQRAWRRFCFLQMQAMEVVRTVVMVCTAIFHHARPSAAR